jgi:uncharacterized protein YrrD
MEQTLEFHKGAPVLGAGRRQLGHLERVVAEPETRTLTHVVVRIGGLFNKADKLVPVGMVVEASPEEVVLTAEAGDLESAPPFEEEKVIAITESEVEIAPTQPGPTAGVYGTPIAGVPMAQPPDRYKAEKVQNIPDGSIALKYGARVLTMDGKSVGSVEAVRIEAPGDHLSHFLISSGLLGKEYKWMLAEWVGGMNEEDLQLRAEHETAFGDLEPERSKE